MKQPLVSICIPTYNRPNYLKQALEACLNQTYKNLEICITDNSDKDIARNIVKKFKRLKINYEKNKKNIGSFNNLQKCAKKAKGKYIKFLLDDDLIEPECIEEMVEVMEKHKNVGLVMSPLKIIDSHGKIANPTFYFFRKMKLLYRYKEGSGLVDKKTIMKDFLTRIYPCCVPTGIMIRKELFDKIGGFDEKFNYIADVDLCMAYAKHSDFYYIDKVLSYWRFGQTSETVNILHRKGIELDIFYRLSKKYSKNKNLSKAEAFFASKRTVINAIAGIKSGNFKLVLKTLGAILYNDKYLVNIFKLPFELLKEVFRAS